MQDKNRSYKLEKSGMAIAYIIERAQEFESVNVERTSETSATLTIDNATKMRDMMDAIDQDCHAEGHFGDIATAAHTELVTMVDYGVLLYAAKIEGF